MGSELSVQWSIENRGTVATFADWQDHILISDDPYLGPADRLLTTVPSADALGVGQQYANQVTVNIPNDLTPGDKYLLVRTDAGQYLAETEETNNYLAVALEVLAPDLAITSYTLPLHGSSRHEDSTQLDGHQYRGTRSAGHVVRFHLLVARRSVGRHRQILDIAVSERAVGSRRQLLGPDRSQPD